MLTESFSVSFGWSINEENPWSAWTAAGNLEAMSCTLWSEDPTLADVATERL